MASGKDRGKPPRAKAATVDDPVKVLICDASSVVRRGLAQMLSVDDGILVVAEVGTSDKVVPLVQQGDIDVVIGDPHQLATDVIGRVLAEASRVLVVSFTVEERHLMQAIASGCSGYVDQRELGAGDLPRLVRLAARGHRSLSDSAFELLRRYLRRSAAVKNGHDFDLPAGRALSKREREVLTHLVRGRTNKQIAQRLGVTDHTVKSQVNRIYEKLEVRNRLDLLTLAIERGWVENGKECKERKAT
jgi:two-component system nitrate/nitrite response regulator NarL